METISGALFLEFSSHACFNYRLTPFSYLWQSTSRTILTRTNRRVPLYQPLTLPRRGSTHLVTYPLERITPNAFTHSHGNCLHTAPALRGASTRRRGSCLILEFWSWPTGSLVESWTSHLARKMTVSSVRESRLGTHSPISVKLDLIAMV